MSTKLHEIRALRDGETLARADQFAWKMAEVAADPAPLARDAVDMTIDRCIDNAAVAIAAANRAPVVTARSQALARPRAQGALLFGLPHQPVSADWAAWANGTAVRELDYHDTFLAADYSHPADNIPPLLAVAQQCGADGAAFLRGVLTAYELHIDLVKGISLHKHAIDHIAHLAPAAAAGIGTMLKLPTAVIYQSIQQALHTSCTTRQSRKGEISSWKAFAPGHAGKIAIEAVDRAMRGERAPSPIYEGADSVLAQLLDGPGAIYNVPLPAPGAPKRAILDSYTKAHSAEYQSQALIDLAIRMAPKIGDSDGIAEIVIHTSHHTHKVIGTGSGDPEKLDPKASRETLDHSIMYIFAVALQDGAWHHVRSYLPERAQRPDTVRLWQRIRTVEDAEWTRRYLSADPKEKAFGAAVEFRFSDGRVRREAIAMADAHPLGARPWKRADYIGKFMSLTEELLPADEARRFLDQVQALEKMDAGTLKGLTPVIPEGRLLLNPKPGLF